MRNRELSCVTIRKKLKLIPPAAGTLAFAVVMVCLMLTLNWAVSKLHPHLHFWSLLSQMMGPVLGTLITSLVVYYLLRVLRRQRELLGTLNHEMRNALQILAYVIPASDGKYQKAAKDALDRMKRVVWEISEQLGG
jgi:uncharacterized membrane protein YgaE (UPF0421/DUF939 family)